MIFQKNKKYEIHLFHFYFIIICRELPKVYKNSYYVLMPFALEVSETSLIATNRYLPGVQQCKPMCCG